jgi:hypothetical protein
LFSEIKYNNGTFHHHLNIFAAALEGLMKRRILSVILCGLLVLSCAPTALAAGDTTPPELISVSLDKTNLATGDKFVITLTIQEDESGLDCTNSLLGFGNSGIYDSGIKPTDATGIYTAEFTVSSSCRTGDYKLEYVWLCDNQSNFQKYDTSEGTLSNAYIVHITNDTQSDFSGPLLMGISVNCDSACVGDTIHVEMKAEDASGLYQGQVCLQLTPWARESINHLPDPDRPNYLVGDYLVNSTTCAGQYTLIAAMLQDNLYNITCYAQKDCVTKGELIMSDADCHKINIINAELAPTRNHIIVKTVQVADNSIKVR